MKHYLLTNQEAARTGCTDLFVVTEADFTATSGGNETITLCSLAIGDVISNVIVDMVTPFAHGNSGTTLDVGYTDDIDCFVDGVNVEAAANVAYAQGNGSGAAATAIGIAAASKNLQAKIILTTTTDVSSMTAGEIRIYAKIAKAGDRQSVQA